MDLESDNKAYLSIYPIEHSQCNDHVMVVSLFSQQTATKGHCEKATETLNKTLCCQLQVVFHMTKNDISCYQYVGLTELLGAVRAPDFVTREDIYWHSNSVDDMEKELGSTVVKQLDEKLKGSYFTGVVIDETVNITMDKKLIIQVKIFNKLVEVLCERDVELSRIIGLGSKGASVMMGNMLELMLF